MNHGTRCWFPMPRRSRYLGLSRLAVAEPSKVRQRLGLASALRGLARDRAGLAVLICGRLNG